jgi:hypothetical protein
LLCSRIIPEVWEYTKENLPTQELKNNLLLATDDERRIASCQAAERGHRGILDEVFKILLLKTEYKERGFWQLTSMTNNLELLEELLGGLKRI